MTVERLWIGQPGPLALHRLEVGQALDGDNPIPPGWMPTLHQTNHKNKTLAAWCAIWSR